MLLGPTQEHGQALNDFVGWCDKAYLELNVSKTKGLSIDFRRSKGTIVQTVIHGENVEIVSSYKYLGTVFDSKLSWDENTNIIVKKGQQRLYFLSKLNLFSVSKSVLSLFLAHVCKQS